MAEWTKDQIIARIRGEADKQKVNPDLAVAIATQESYLNPNASGDNGNSLGLFQLQPAAAIDVGVNPKWRQDPDVNIYGGVKYLAQKLQQSKGNVEDALRRYNGGGDPNYVQNVMRFFKPGVAEAAERPQAGTYSDTDVQNALKVLQMPQDPSQPQGGTYGEEDVQNALRALQGSPDAAAPPFPPTATSTPEQDAAYRASRGQQGGTPSSQTTPTPRVSPRPQEAPPQPDTSWTPGMRFQALPSIMQLDPADRAQKTKLFESLDPASQEEFLRSEEPAAGGLAAGGGPVAISQPVTDPAALLAVGGKPTRTREQELLAEARARPRTPAVPLPPGVPTIEQETLEEGITAPSTMIPLLMPGAGLKLVPGALKTAAPLLNRAVRPVAEGLSQTAGWTAGRTAETGAVPSPAEIGTEAAFNVAAGGVLETIGATGQALLRRSQAGKAIVAADEATTAARARWQADTQAAEAAAQGQQKELYDTAVIKAKASQREYEMAVRARQEKIAVGQQEYQEALRAQQADDLAKEQARQQTIAQRQQEYQDAIRVQQADDLAKQQTRQQTITQRQQEYQQAITGQQQAITQARATPGRYTPETPSWVQYEKFGDAAKDAVVDLTPAKAALAEVRASRGTLPDGSIRPFPTAVETIAANLEKATGETSFKTIREELRRLGPLTKSQDGNVRGAAKQLYGIYADVLEASPVANELLRNANATFRKEMAVQDIADWLKPGHGIVRIDNQGRETINVGALMTRLEKTVADDSLFRRSFAPEELDALRADLRQLAGTPAMPRGVPREPAPVVPGTPPVPPREPAPVVPGRLPTPPREPAPVALPADVPVKQIPMPQATPAPAPVTPREALGARPRFTPTEGQLGAVGGLAYLGQLFGIPMKAVAVLKAGSMVSKQLRYGTARMILGAQSRPQLMETLRKVQGRVGPPLYGTLLHGLSAAERKALQRETKEQQR